MKEIIVRVDIKDHPEIQSLPNFKCAWEYAHPNIKINPREWGKIVFGDIELKFYSYSDIGQYFKFKTDPAGRIYPVDFPDIGGNL